MVAVVMDHLMELRARLSLSKGWGQFEIPMGSAVGYIDVTPMVFQGCVVFHFLWIV